MAQSVAYEPELRTQAVTFDDDLPSRRGLQKCLAHFFKRHFRNDFCSFAYEPHFEDKAMSHSFLATAVVALCARYLSGQDAQRDFGEASNREVYKCASTLAKRFARESSDQPSGNLADRIIGDYANFNSSQYPG